MIDADHALIKRVFSNLIQNALTHSARAVDGHARRARARAAARCSPSPTTASGIPPEYHDIIFRKFEQVKTPHIPRVRSSGLGLAFCKLVVEAHGGTHLGEERPGPAGKRVPLLASRASAGGLGADRERSHGVKLFLRTFGCRANQYDSEAVRAMVDGRGRVARRRAG